NNVHRQKFLSVAAVLKIRVAAQNVSKFVRENRRKLRLVVHQSQQTSADVNRTIGQSECIRLRIAQRAKVPRNVFKLLPARQQGDTKQSNDQRATAFENREAGHIR